MNMINVEQYYYELENQTSSVFRAHPELRDHRESFPWLTGDLGDPFSGIWFLAENPSLKMLERATNPGGGPLTKEAQWYASRGAKLFREKLVKYGFKKGCVDTLGGWNCYISNVIKEADYSKDWRAKTQDLLRQAVDVWMPVLQWEIANSKPKLVVAVGRQAEKYVKYLRRDKGVRFPRVEFMQHYAYIGQRAEGKLGPMHPIRVQKYDDQMAAIHKLNQELMQK